MESPLSGIPVDYHKPILPLAFRLGNGSVWRRRFRLIGPDGAVRFCG
jgi:hypothetical protein